MKKSVAICLCLLLAGLMMAGCGQKPQTTASPSPSAGETNADEGLGVLTGAQKDAVYPLLYVVQNCSDKGFTGDPPDETAALVVYNMVNYAYYTSSDGNMTEDWISNDLLRKIYGDCFTEGNVPSLNQYALMEKKDDGYSYSLSDMAENYKMTLDNATTQADGKVKVTVTLSSYEEDDQTGAGTFLLVPKSDSKFGFSVYSFTFTFQ